MKRVFKRRGRDSRVKALKERTTSVSGQAIFYIMRTDLTELGLMEQDRDFHPGRWVCGA